jgi:hypothetical protein
MLGTAAVAAQLALVFLSLALWWVLGDAIGRGWAALVVGLVWGLVALVTGLGGRNRLRRVSPIAPRTVDTTTNIPDALRGRES